MKKQIVISITLLILLTAAPASSFEQQSCGPKECQECHWLTTDEAKDILGNLVDEVLAVNYSEVSGFWEVDVLKSNRKLPVYIDFSKNFLVTGKLIRLQTMENLTDARFRELNRVDISKIPLDDAVIIGEPSAGMRIIVFDDPECPYCRKLHQEMKDIVQKRKDIAFYIKMLPLKIHPTAYEKAKSIICSGLARMLEDSLNGKDLPPPSCETDQIEKNTALAEELNILSVPTVIYPDGMVVPGFAEAERILQLLEQAVAGLPAQADQ